MQSMLNDCQRNVFNEIMHAIFQNEGGVFFLDGPGVSGKTFVYNYLVGTLQGQQNIALAIASSGLLHCCYQKDVLRIHVSKYHWSLLQQARVT